jgi:FKBP-type peptidyl-prolyl cis-trans isomerase 2
MSTENNESVVTDGDTVNVHYSLTVDGNLIDSSSGKEPLKFQVGSGQVIPGFNDAVKGMKVGEKRSFEISPAEGYGEENPAAFKDVPRDSIPAEITPEAGMTLHAKGPNGESLPVMVKEVKDDVVVLNLNHPLAGKTLNFDIEVVEIL